MTTRVRDNGLWGNGVGGEALHKQVMKKQINYVARQREVAILFKELGFPRPWQQVGNARLESSPTGYNPQCHNPLQRVTILHMRGPHQSSVAPPGFYGNHARSLRRDTTLVRWVYGAKVDQHGNSSPHNYTKCIPPLTSQPQTNQNIKI